MPKKKVRPFWFDWDTRWAPRTFLVDPPVTGHKVSFIVPHDTYIHVTGFSSLLTSAPGIRSTSAILLFYRGANLMYMQNIPGPVGNGSTTWFVFNVSVIERGVLINPNFFRVYTLPDYIYLQPNDLITFELIDPLENDELTSTIVTTRSFNA